MQNKVTIFQNDTFFGSGDQKRDRLLNIFLLQKSCLQYFKQPSKKQTTV